MDRLPRLKELGLGVRLGLSFLLLTLGIGYAAGLAYMVQHHGKKDLKPELSLDDLKGAYHGVSKQAPLRAAIEGSHAAEYTPAEELATLRAWLKSKDLNANYDSLDLGEYSPAEVLEENCLSCHAREATEGNRIGKEIPLEDWFDVSKVAFDLEMSPPDIEILTVSTHTHALTLPLVALMACGLFLLTRWPNWLKQAVFALGGLGLFLDIAGWWWARENEAAVMVLIVAGGVFGACVGIALVGSLVDMWLPGGRRRRAEHAS